MKEEEIHKIVKRQEESRLLHRQFRMVCLWCRKVVIESEDIKTIYQTHHVVVNRNILSQTKTIPYRDFMYVDELKMIGSVRCSGEPEKGKRCNNKIGSMMVYSKVPFIVLGIENFGFDLGGPHGLEYYNQWKKVPYFIDEIGPEDFKRYLPEKNNVSEKSDDNDNEQDSEEEEEDKVDEKQTDTSPAMATSLRTVQTDTSPAMSTSLRTVPSSTGLSETELKHVYHTLTRHGDSDSGLAHSDVIKKGSNASQESSFQKINLADMSARTNTVTIETHKKAAGHALSHIIQSGQDTFLSSKTSEVSLSNFSHLSSHISTFKPLPESILKPPEFSDFEEDEDSVISEDAQGLTNGSGSQDTEETEEKKIIIRPEDRLDVARPQPRSDITVQGGQEELRQLEKSPSMNGEARVSFKNMKPTGNNYDNPRPIEDNAKMPCVGENIANISEPVEDRSNMIRQLVEDSLEMVNPAADNSDGIRHTASSPDVSPAGDSAVMRGSTGDSAAKKRSAGDGPYIQAEVCPDLTRLANSQRSIESLVGVCSNMDRSLNNQDSNAEFQEATKPERDILSPTNTRDNTDVSRTITGMDTISSSGDNSNLGSSDDTKNTIPKELVAVGNQQNHQVNELGGEPRSISQPQSFRSGLDLL